MLYTSQMSHNIQEFPYLYANNFRERIINNDGNLLIKIEKILTEQLFFYQFLFDKWA